MKSLVRTASILAGVLLVSGAALAEESADTLSTGFDHRVAPVRRALEIGVGGGYSQGAGDVAAQGARIQDLSGPGGTVELKLGYRALSNLAFGAYGTFAQFGSGDSVASGTDVRSATAGAWADWHFRPDRSVDPWIGLSSGWRGLWLSPDTGKNTSLQGWEIARLQVGVDYRVTPEIAIGPVIGASVNTFFTQDGPGTDGFQNISDPHANVFFFGGLQARFDVAGEREEPAQGQAVQARNER